MQFYVNYCLLSAMRDICYKFFQEGVHMCENISGKSKAAKGQ